MFSRYFFWPIVVTGLCAALFGACSRHETASPKPENVTLATARVPFSKLIYLAQREGLFAREGLDMTLIPVGTGKEALDLMLKGKADMSAAASMPIMAAVMDGARPVLLATLCQSETDNALIARGERGIIDATDLRGKKVGVAFRTSAHFYLHNLLVDASVPYGSVRIIDLAPAAAVKGMEEGRLDATVQFFPWDSRAARAAGRKVTINAPPLYSTHWILAANSGFMESRPQTAQKILRSLVAAEKLASEQPGLLTSAAEEMLDEPIADLQRRLSQYKDKVNLPQSMIVTLENEARWYRSQHSGAAASSDIPNFLSYIDSRPLKNVRPESVKFTE